MTQQKSDTIWMQHNPDEELLLNSVSKFITDLQEENKAIKKEADYWQDEAANMAVTIEVQRKLREALERLVSLYIANLGRDGEFISCITPPAASEMTATQRADNKAWAAWDAARKALSQPPAPEQASRPPKDACDEGQCPDPELCESEQYCCFRASPAAPVAAKPEQQAQIGEPEVVAEMRESAILDGEIVPCLTAAGQTLQAGEQLITLQSHREAIAKAEKSLSDVSDVLGQDIADLMDENAKKDAALLACVEALLTCETREEIQEWDKVDVQRFDTKKVFSAISQANGALK